VYTQNKHQRSEIDHLLRVVKPHSGDIKHKEEKNIYFTMTLIKIGLAIIFIVLMNIQTITIFQVRTIY